MEKTSGKDRAAGAHRGDAAPARWLRRHSAMAMAVLRGGVIFRGESELR
jgi:hypothetical protein